MLLFHELNSKSSFSLSKAQGTRDTRFPLLLAWLCQWASPGYSAPELDSAQSGQAAFTARKKNNTKPGLQNRLFVLTIGPVPVPTPNL